MTNTKQSPPLISGRQKIRGTHLQRRACIYVRQSTPKQVTYNKESQRYQRLLAERAEALGWSTKRIQVIDTDLAQSGEDSHSRTGFQDLVAAVSLGHVGIIFGYEVSRLARNNSDWYHLLDLAAVFDTLIADNDGLYHPRLYNDRLLLGLKGTMSEAELHLLRQRLDAGRLNQVKRGEYRQRLPTGLVRLADGSVVKDPDEQVRHTLALVFTQFERLGSGRQTAIYFRQAGILLPRRQMSGAQVGEIVWKPATSSAIRNILNNPAYAGAFAYGRKQADPMKRQPGHPNTGRVAKSIDEWIHLQHDVYPAYITWAQYLANRTQLQKNQMRHRRQGQQAQGAIREGSALLQGIVVCGVCGRHMSTHYHHVPRYTCESLRDEGLPNCLLIRGPRVDTVVVQAFFEALAPTQLNALEAVLAAQQVEHEQVAARWQQRRQRAQYEVNLAARQYHAVDPDNRLVAAELERRWETKLHQRQETKEAYERWQQTSVPRKLTPQLRQQFQHISQSLPQVWPDLAYVQQKKLLRTLIDQVILRRDTPDKVSIKIVWVSGHYSPMTVYTPVQRQQSLPTYPILLQRIQELSQEGLTDQEIASQLTSEGLHTARRLDVNAMAVAKIRRKQGIPSLYAQHRRGMKVQGRFTTRGLAAHLDTTRAWVYNQIRRGVIPVHCVTRHPQTKAILIEDDLDLIEMLRSLL